VVSPDAGGVERARFFAKKVDAALAIVDKRRMEMNVADMNSSVTSRAHLLDHRRFDRYGRYAGQNAAPCCRTARRCVACCSHPVLSGRRGQNGLLRSGGTNTVPLTEAASHEPDQGALHCGVDWPGIQSIHEELR